MNTHDSSPNPSVNTAVASAQVLPTAVPMDPMPWLIWMLMSKMLSPVHNELLKAGVEVFDWSPALWEQVEIKAGQRKVKPIVRPTRGELAAASATAQSSHSGDVGEFGL